MGFEIPIDVDYFDHPKTLKLISILRIREADIYPIRLWKWAAKYARTGQLPLDYRSVEVQLGWRSAPGRLHRALCSAGFIEADGVTIHDWNQHVGRSIAIYESKKRKQREKYDREKGIIPEESRKNSGSLPPTQDTQEGKPRMGGDTEPPPPSAAPSAPPLPTTGVNATNLLAEAEAREVDRTVAAFGFCAMPGTKAKAMAIVDLRRQGVSHEFIRAIAANQEQKDFYEIIRSIQKGKATPAFKASESKPKTCARCGGTGQIVDHSKTPLTSKNTAFKPCPDCRRSA